MKNEWKPNIGVGDIKFRDNITNVKKIMPLDIEKDLNNSNSELEDWISYSNLEDDIRIDFEDDKVVCITCYEECNYKGQNLIGLKLLELEKLLDQQADEVGDYIEYEDGDIHQDFNYDDLGLQACLKEEKVLYVSFLDATDDEE